MGKSVLEVLAKYTESEREAEDEGTAPPENDTRGSVRETTGRAPGGTVRRGPPAHRGRRRHGHQQGRVRHCRLVNAGGLRSSGAGVLQRQSQASVSLQNRDPADDRVRQYSNATPERFSDRATLAFYPRQT